MGEKACTFVHFRVQGHCRKKGMPKEWVRFEILCAILLRDEEETRGMAGRTNAFLQVGEGTCGNTSYCSER